MALEIIVKVLKHVAAVLFILVIMHTQKIALLAVSPKIANATLFHHLGIPPVVVGLVLYYLALHPLWVLCFHIYFIISVRLRVEFSIRHLTAAVLLDQIIRLLLGKMR